MSDASKKPKKTDEEDLISRLPDEILTYILSFLFTKFAVATSVLSKRWKLVWTSVPNLDFTFRNKCSKSTWEEREAHFKNFIDRVLSLNKVMSVRSIKLYCDGLDGPDVIRTNAWLKALETRDAEKFDLCLPYSFLIKDVSLCSLTKLNWMPDKFFKQKNLVDLKLTHVILKIPPLVCFPSLKTIKLDSVQLMNDGSLKNLLSGCPTLTDLCIDQKQFSDLCIDQKQFSNKLVLYICSSTLQNLEIITFEDYEDCYTKVVIDAPKLTYLNLNERLESVTNYDVINVSSLVKASISRVTNEEKLLELLRKISHVKEVFLKRGIMSFFEGGSLTKLPIFSNLIHLTLEIQHKEGLTVLPRLLDYTPNVVTIVLQYNLQFRQYHRYMWNESLDLPQSVLSCIESVEITEEKGESMPVISCILNSATALKKLFFHGLPVHFVLEDHFLKTLLTTGQVKCKCTKMKTGLGFCPRDQQEWIETIFVHSFCQLDLWR